MPEKYVIKRAVDSRSFKIDYAKELNAEQLRVVKDGEGPVLVLAGAGSGKTRTIVYRVAYLLERGIRPDNILLVTFTNKAAKEMLLRIEELLGAYPKGLWGGTFHHVANLLLRKYASAVGYPPNFTILDGEDAKSLLAVCVKEEGIDVKARRFPAPAVLGAIVSLSRNSQQAVGSIVADRYANFLPLVSTIELVAKRYEERKRKNHLVDFDDLLVLLDRLLKERADVRERLGKQFRYVLVDEYQDTNRIQSSIVRQLASVQKNLLVVGDDAQSIYSFRGATVENILDFPKQYPDCQTYRLETNYRSTAQVLDLANEVIEQNPHQFKKTLKPVRKGGVRPIVVPASSTEQEAEFISQRILEFRDEAVSLNNIAVLFRATYQSQSLEFELTRRDVPYDYRGGLRFFERAHIKDVLAYLKLVDNPRDEVAFLRVLQLYPGIGLETAVKLWRVWFSRVGNIDFQHEDWKSALNQRSAAGFASFRKTFDPLLKAKEERPSDLIERITKSDYRNYLEVTFPNAAERLEDLNELGRFSERYRSLSSFLADVSLQESFGMAGEAAEDAEDEKMILSTIHQAKGLEWEVVFLIGCTEGAFPNPRALKEEGGIEEERRLFYVAVTRAKTHLFLTYPMGTNLRMTSMYLQRPSQFLSELPKDLFDELALEEQETDESDVIIERDESGEPMGLLDTLLAAHERRKRGRREGRS